MTHCNRFTQTSINLLDMARDKAIFCGHEQIGSEHLLLAFLEKPSPAFEQAMRTLDCIPEGAHDYAMTKVGVFALSPKDLNVESLPHSQTLTRILSAAASKTEGDITDDHLLLALLEDRGHCAAINLLRTAMCIDPGALRDELVHSSVDLVDA